MQTVGYINTNKDHLHGQKTKFWNWNGCVTNIDVPPAGYNSGLCGSVTEDYDVKREGGHFWNQDLNTEHSADEAEGIAPVLCCISQSVGTYPLKNHILSTCSVPAT